MTRLQDSVRVTLDASGNGTVRFGPDRPNTRWIVTGVGVQVSTSVNTPTANVYRGTANPGTFISGTGAGSNDADNALYEALWPGEFLTVQWVGGDAGSVATASYRGEIETGV